MSNKEVKQILTDARALVKRGWIQNEFYRLVDGVPCYCAVGAMDDASMGHLHGDSWGAITALRKALPTSCRWGVTNFNDAPETTQDDVLALFDRAIESVS